MHKEHFRREFNCALQSDLRSEFRFLAIHHYRAVLLRSKILPYIVPQPLPNQSIG